ncbi:potassium-transporting ATPase subunit KdpA [Trinickia symbiotica]|uniref:potassium-transporting ATPase subunit KdpA n=1 Tax=Trinickia symbiotica TaxID=863227 RepID=UPI00215983C7|nr:potassium-transporting ATPase subunit KdpA [Trinickia symbiotica]
MWINCVFGGKGAGMIDLLLLLIIGVFIAGQMVARATSTPSCSIKPARSRLAVAARPPSFRSGPPTKTS